MNFADQGIRFRLDQLEMLRRKGSGTPDAVRLLCDDIRHQLAELEAEMMDARQPGKRAA